MDTDDPNEDLKTFADRLQSDRVIKIFVGPGSPDERKPFLVQQSILENASEYFRNALKPGTFREGEEGLLEFPKDSPDTWKIFLYWLFNRDVFHLNLSQKTLVQCWCLGDKYQVSPFQDLIMWRLLIRFRSGLIDLDAIKEGFENSHTHSKLRELLVEEAVARHKSDDSSLSRAQFEYLDGLGFIGPFMEILSGWQPGDDFDRLAPTGNDGDIAEDWKEYMVGDGPNFPFAYVCKWSIVKGWDE